MGYIAMAYVAMAYSVVVGIDATDYMTTLLDGA